MVWCGIVNDYLTGPYFFDGNVDRHLLRVFKGPFTCTICDRCWKYRVFIYFLKSFCHSFIQMR